MKNLHRLSVILLLVCLIFSLIAIPAFAQITINQNPGLADLYGVNISSPSNDDILKYNSVSGLWVNNNSLSIIFTNISNLINDITSLNVTQVDQENNISLLQGYVSTLQSIVSVINSTLNGAVVNVTALQSAFYSLNITLTNMQGDISTLQGNVTTIQSDVSALQSQLSSLNSTVISNTNAIDSLNSTIISNNGNITGLKSIALIWIIDGGGSAITTGVKGDLYIPFGCNITGWTLLTDQSGSTVIDIWKDNYTNFPPTAADTITGSEKPTLSSAQKNQDLNLTTWTTEVSAGDDLRFNVDSASIVTRVTLILTATRVV
jgi:peptidoglycan hydrolase CwlO-like protein